MNNENCLGPKKTNWGALLQEKTGCYYSIDEQHFFLKRHSSSQKMFSPHSENYWGPSGCIYRPPSPPPKKKQCWQAFAGRLIGITLPLVCYTQPPFRHVPTHHLPRQCCGRQNTTVPNEGVTLKKKTLPKLKNSLLHTERKCFFDSMFASFHPLRNPLKPKITPFIYT